MQKYFRWPFKAITVPTQFRGLILKVFDSHKDNLSSSEYHNSPFSISIWPNNSVLDLRYGHTALWNAGISLGRVFKSVTKIIVLHPGFNNRTMPLYFSALSSCNFNSGGLQLCFRTKRNRFKNIWMKSYLKSNIWKI